MATMKYEVKHLTTGTQLEVLHETIVTIPANGTYQLCYRDDILVQIWLLRADPIRPLFVVAYIDLRLPHRYCIHWHETRDTAQKQYDTLLHDNNVRHLVLASVEQSDHF